MRKKDSFMLALLVTLAMAALQATAVGQTQDRTAESKASIARADGAGIRFDSAIPYSSATLTVSAPDGNVYRREFTGGASLSFPLLDKAGAPLGDGPYTYELRFTTSQVVRDIKERVISAPDEGKEDEQGRVTRRRQPSQGLVQSGSFTVQNGALIMGGEIESTNSRQASVETIKRAPAVSSGNTLNRLRNHRISLATAMPDQVIPDDLIVQGSACIGLDCVNNESFGFDTIRLKENNTRIKFEDTSVGSFPSTDWQLTANDSASGASNKFSIEDITTAKVPFTVIGGAPTNSVFVASNGKVGFRTSTPVLDLHVTTSDTPAHRFEQTNAGGFTAQTWDVAGNEANFFVRDVTGGSRLPFRIRPGAPTSSIDISATGDVGVGTASPNGKLHVSGNSTAGISFFFENSATGGKSWRLLSTGTANTGGAGIFGLVNSTDDPNNYKLMLTPAGNVGIGTSAPTDTLSVNGTASKTGGGSWSNFSDERLKNIKGRYNTGLSAVMKLQPLRYEYKKDNPLGLKSQGEYVGFGAQAVQQVIPEAVSKSQSGYLMVNNDPIIWTMLNAIKEQQKEIAELKGQIKKLQSSANRRRR